MTDRNDPNDPLAGIEPYHGYDEPSAPGPAPTRRGDDGTPPMLPSRSPLLTGLVLGLMLVVVSIAVFQLLSDEETDGAGVAGDTTVPPGTGEPEDGQPEATDGDGGAEPTATDGTGDTDGTNGDTTDGTGVEPGGSTPYEAVGEPIPVAELTMGVDGIGPIALGQPAADAVGRLVATFGPPEEDSGAQASVGEWGVCAGDLERIVRWGPLAVVVVVDPDGSEVFAGYRLDFSLGGFAGPTADLATVSGLQAGTSFRVLEQIYETFDVRDLEDPDHGRIWELRSTETGNLLLWGPLTDEDVVRGIFSNDPCGTF